MMDQNELPKGWVVKKLGEVCERISEKWQPAQQSVYYVGLEHIEKGTGKILQTAENIEATAIKSVFQKGDILYGKLRPYLNKVAVANIDGVCSTDILVLRTKQLVANPLFLHLLMFSNKFVNEMSANTNGVNLPRVPADFVMNYEIPLPPLPEQHRIVTKIEELFSQLDNGIAQLKTARAQLKVYRQAVLKWAFEGKLTNVEVKKGELPEGWKWVKIGELGRVQLGRQRSPKNVSKDFPTKYIRAANITENGLDLADILEMEFTPKEFEQYRLQCGDIVLSEASGSPKQVGKPAIWKNQIENCCFQNTVIRLRPREGVSQEYLLLLFRYFYLNGLFAKIAGGVGINHLSAGKFSNITISLPSLSEQNLIVQEIESRLSVCDKLEETIGQGLQQAEALRQSILKRAFEGKLVAQEAGV